MARNRGAAARSANRAAVQASAKSQLRGAGGFRKLLRQMPEAVKNEMAETLDRTGDELLAAMKADAPVKTGALRAGLAKKLLKASLRLRVGIVTKPLARKLFYARILEFGRKKSAKARSSTMAGRPFVTKKRTSIRTRLRTRLNAMWDMALGRASVGAVD